MPLLFGDSISESPRRPSPWQSRTLTPTGQGPTLDSCLAYTAGSPPSLVPEEDLSGHIEYKLRLPARPTVERLARLTSQLKWRLLEGGGESIYELGVCDNGLLLGIDRTEMDASLGTMRLMADSLGATVTIAKEVEISNDGIKELLGADSPSMSLYANMAPPTIHAKQVKGKLARQRPVLSAEPRRNDDSYTASSYGDAEDDSAFMVFEGIDDLLEPQPSTSSLPQLEVERTCKTASISDDGPPSLSHSPSPPSSRAGSLDTEILAHIVSSRTPLHIPSEQEERDRVRQAERRQLRKQWKQERHKRKQLERAEERNAINSRQCRMHSGSLRIASSPQDQYLDALASLFEKTSLEEEQTADELNALLPENDHCMCEQPAHNHYHRVFRKQRRKMMAYSPTSVPLDSRECANYFAKDTFDQESWASSLSANAARILGHKKAAAQRVADGVKRYAVECVITIVDDERDGASKVQSAFAEADKVAGTSVVHTCELPLLSAVTTQLDLDVKDHLTDSSHAGKPLHRLQTIVDFDTVWDELGSQLSH